MAETETTILLAVFDDISRADHAVDMLWEWSESKSGAGPDAVGVLVNQHLRLDAQLIGEDSGYGEETGMALDIFEIILSNGESGNAETDQDPSSAAKPLATLLGLEEWLVKRLRQDLNRGQAILLLVPSSEDLQGSRAQLEDHGGQITILEIPRATLFRAAALLDEDAFDDDDDYDFDYYDGDDESFAAGAARAWLAADRAGAGRTRLGAPARTALPGAPVSCPGDRHLADDECHRPGALAPGARAIRVA